jgi:general secretion pathway protein G
MGEFVKPRFQWSPRRSAPRGFTLLELMIVIAIISILVSIGAMQYQKVVLRSREAVLHQDLFVMRDAIQKYTGDKEEAPQSLQDLVDKGYLGAVPVDPITRGQDWATGTCDTVLDPDQVAGGICDVHSTSDQVSPFEGTPYSSW